PDAESWSAGELDPVAGVEDVDGEPGGASGGVPGSSPLQPGSAATSADPASDAPNLLVIDVGMSVLSPAVITTADASGRGRRRATRHPVPTEPSVPRTACSPSPGPQSTAAAWTAPAAR